MTAALRIRQGVRALLAFSRPVDYALAADYLSPPLLALFRKMRRSEQIHSLNVLRAVLAQEADTPPDLAVAALLHDVGKSRYPLMIWQKTLPVLVRLASPALLRRWSGGDPRKLWLRPFVVYVHHPAWSADMIAAAGASETAVWLVRQHQQALPSQAEHESYHWLKRLQAADDTN
jgi:hypothetical protein